MCGISVANSSSVKYYFVTSVCDISEFGHTYTGFGQFQLVELSVIPQIMKFVLRHLATSPFTSEYGIVTVASTGSFKATLAAASAVSFPQMPIWLGIQQNRISFR